MKTITEMLVGCEHDGSFIPVNEVRRLLKEYAELYHAEKSKGQPTDKDIQKAAMEWQEDTTTSFNQGMYSGYIFGAIDMRNGKIKSSTESKPELSLRDELIKFMQWHSGNESMTNDEDLIKIIDIYLK